MQTVRNILDVVLGALLTLGCALALPIYWWLFVTPLVSLWNQCRANQSKLTSMPA